MTLARTASRWAAVSGLVTFLCFAGPELCRADDLFVLHARVLELRHAGKLEEALALAKRVVELSEKTLPGDHPFIHTSRESFAALYREQGQRVQTEISALNRRVTELHRAGRIAEATPLAERSLALTRAQKGEDHVDTAARMLWLAFLYNELGRLADAEPLLRRALEINEKAQPANNSLIAASAHHLANLYLDQGRFDEAEALYKRALTIREALPGERLGLAATLSNLAGLHSGRGRLAEAEALYKRSVEIHQAAQPANHPDIAQALYNLGIFYSDRSRHAEAELLLRRALEIIEQSLPAGHPNIARVLNGLACHYREQGRYAEAEPLAKRVLEINEKAYPTGHSIVAQSLYNLGLVYHAQRRLDEAEPLYQRALEMREKVLWAGHPDVAWSLHNLAGLYYARGRLAEAELLLQRALEMREKILPASDNAIVLNLNNLAAIEYQREAWDLSVQYARRAAARVIERARRVTRPVAIGTGETSRLELSSNASPFVWLRGAAWRLAEQQPNRLEALSEEAYKGTQWTSQSSAGSALAQMAARFSKGEGELARLVREHQNLAAAWQALDKDVIAARTAPPERRNADAEQALSLRVADTERGLAALNDRLANEFPEYAALAGAEPLSFEATQALLRNDEALVLLADAPRETFIWIVTKTATRWLRSGLGTRALAQRVAVLRCGLDQAAWDADKPTSCADFFKGGFSAADAEAGKPLPFDLSLAHELYRALFGEAEDLIDGKHLLIVPSGPLTVIPFQALIADKPAVTIPTDAAHYAEAAWLAQRHAITVLPSVASLRALRQLAKVSKATQPFIGFGNPLLTGPAGTDNRAGAVAGCAKTAPVQVARGSVRGTASSFFRGNLADVERVRQQHPLPETADELCAVARSIGAPEASVHLGENASEATIKALSNQGELGNARIVHFATHGLLASESGNLGASSVEPALILTPPAKATEEDDGLLTASEITQLKLDADWVVLSACNTAAGGGADRNAEALSGLARAFFYAGARALLVSHWAVDSHATVRLISEAFHTLSVDQQIGRAEALRRSMLALIASGGGNAHPSKWAAFAVVGEGREPARDLPMTTSSIPRPATPQAAKPTQVVRKKASSAKKVEPPDWRSQVWRQ
jgi:CHAT domain-containing protein/Tfp pilus assembly protein PilF